MNLNEWAETVHDVAVSKGWWENDRDFGALLTLIHCELSEAYEEYRHDKPLHYTHEGKPEGTAIELVDALIRILDTLASLGVDIDELMTLKNEFNKTRPYRHGGLRS